MTITVEVSVFAGLRRYLSRYATEDIISLCLPAGTTIDGLVRTLGIPLYETRQVYVDSRLHEGGYILQNGEKITIFPPIAGG